MRRLKIAHALPFLAGLVLVALALAGSRSEPVRAAPHNNDQVAAPVTQQVDNSVCLACHSRPDFNLEMSGGETLSLTIDEEKFSLSVHGENEIACTSCHTDFTGFPHPELKAASPREIATTYYTTCQQCHSEQYTKVLDSVHQIALAGGNTNAAVCTDSVSYTHLTLPTNREV